MPISNAGDAASDSSDDGFPVWAILVMAAVAALLLCILLFYMVYSRNETPKPYMESQLLVNQATPTYQERDILAESTASAEIGTFNTPYTGAAAAMGDAVGRGRSLSRGAPMSQVEPDSYRSAYNVV